MTHKQLIAFVLLIGTLLITGCWNSKELTDLSLISAVGIDRSSENDYKVSFQIINAAEVAAGHDGGSRDATTTVVYSASGNTIFEAIRKTTQEIPRKIYFPHTNLIVISEAFAKEEGIDKVIDWFERDHEFRTNIQVVIARDTTAEDILKIQSPVERIAAKKIIKQLETTEKVNGENFVVEIDDIIKSLISKGQELSLSGFKITGLKEEGQKIESLQQSVPIALLEVSGIGLFKEGKLVKWIEGRPARGLNWINDRIESTIVNLDCEEQKNKIAIEIIRSKTKINSIIKNGIPKIFVTINTEGNFGEVDCAIELERAETIDLLEKQLSEVIKSEIRDVINIAQKEKLDFFGFGNVVERQQRQYWKKNEDNWPELFSTLEVDVQVNSYIRRTGMRINSFRN